MVTKPLGVEFLFVRKIESTGDWGIYKGNGKNGLLLFVYSKMNEAVTAAEAIARTLGLKVQNSHTVIQSLV